MTWQPSADGVLAFDRGSSFRCVANLSAEPVALPPNASALLASGPLDTGLLPPDTSVWLRIG
jgi:alpha-glucosidase